MPSGPGILYGSNEFIAHLTFSGVTTWAAVAQSVVLRAVLFWLRCVCTCVSSLTKSGKLALRRSSIVSSVSLYIPLLSCRHWSRILLSLVRILANLAVSASPIKPEQNSRHLSALALAMSF